jgi:protein SCO1
MKRAGTRVSYIVFAAVCGLLLLPGLPAEGHGDEDHEETGQAQVNVEEHLGLKIPGDISFLDENGSPVVLGSFIDKPTLVLPVYYSCPKTCGLLLANLALALASVPQAPGRDYRVLALSIDDEDTPATALQAKRNYVKTSGGKLDESWKFLVGDNDSIKKFTAALGFRFKKTARHEFAHPNVLIALAPGVTIIRYLYGPSFLPFDIGMALTEAGRGTPELSVRKLVSYCFVYDGEGKTYVFTAVRILGLGSLLALAIVMAFLLRKRGR